MKILVAGAHGQLGRELVSGATELGLDVVAGDLPELDITSADQVRAYLQLHSPDIVFNAAAWTAVDEAESREADAYRINHDGAANLAESCHQENLTLVHYSTDYVFDGTKGAPYSEDDAPNPINVYGSSKLASEEAVTRNCEKHLIFRTSWLFSEHGANFVKTMLRLGRERADLRVVADQTGKPTSARELARCSLVAAMQAQPTWGTYHLAQPNPVSWYDFATQIFAEARHQGVELSVEDVTPVSSDEFPTAAIRPQNSVLDCSKFENTFQVRIRNWKDSLADVIEQLKGDDFFS